LVVSEADHVDPKSSNPCGNGTAVAMTKLQGKEDVRTCVNFKYILCLQDHDPTLAELSSVV
jgi:hypothetical protein